MAPTDPRRRDEALDWVRRIHEPDFADWDAHLAWLEASPENNAAFDAASLAIEETCLGLAPSAGVPPRGAALPSANDNGPDRRRSPGRRVAPLVGFGIAAGIVGLVAVPTLRGRHAQPYGLATAPGEQTSVRLPDGTRVALNGDTEVQLDHADPRIATVLHGEALFDVIHDPRHPFAVRAGDATFQDVGTSFDVVRAPSRTIVAVREGAILYDPGGTRLRVDAGHALRLAGGGDATLTPVVPASVGGWRAGRLTYAGAPISEVAEDLARATGRPVAVDHAALGRSFSGVIVLDRDRATLARRVSAVTGLAMTPEGTGWRMALPAR